MRFLIKMVSGKEKHCLYLLIASNFRTSKNKALLYYKMLHYQGENADSWRAIEAHRTRTPEAAAHMYWNEEE